ncbi:MAG TPA: HPr family phosphocarrier protein [Bacteriovoracaceae bacterium]|nr:HPr family phosphocarrier protein [Bacteriovoracaceae bacterium]
MQKVFRILNEEGLHARPAGALAKTAAEFTSSIEIRANGMTKNAKSIMGVMSLGLSKDAEITIVASGEDEAEALEKLEQLITNKFQI